MVNSSVTFVSLSGRFLNSGNHTNIANRVRGTRWCYRWFYQTFPGYDREAPLMTKYGTIVFLAEKAPM